MSISSWVMLGGSIVAMCAFILLAYFLPLQPRANSTNMPPTLSNNTATTSVHSASSTLSAMPMRSTATSSVSIASTHTNFVTEVKQSTTSPNAAVPTPSSTATLSIPTPAPEPLEEVNAKLRSSLVNILCTTKSGGSFRPISGSGVIIDTRGIILTNAHVGQFFLLKDFPTPGSVDCVVRTGSPAQAKYYAKLLYLPPEWVHENARQIVSPDAVGTGENDYAFLLITSTTSGAPLPTSFPALTMSLDEPSKGNAVVLAAYPAQFLGGTTIQLNLYASSAITTVENVYTFGSSTIDVLSLGHTVVSQSGSSGGAVARALDGDLIGIIATATEGTTTDVRDLNGITLAHVNRSLVASGKGGIAQLLLNSDIQKDADDFTTIVAPNLTKELTDALTHK